MPREKAARWGNRPGAGLALREFRPTGGSVIFMVSFLTSAALGVVRQVLFNAHFGVGSEASAYYAAIRLPETLGLLLTGGALANAMVPVLLNVAHTEGAARARWFVNLVTTTLLAIITPLVLLGMLAAPWFVSHILAPGFDLPTSHLTITLTRIMLTELLLVVVVSVATAVLMSRNQFLLPAVGIAVHNFTLILGILAAMHFPSIGVYGPTIGTITDALLQLVILLPGLYRQGMRYRPAWSPGNPHLHAVIQLLVPGGLSSGVNYAGGIVDTAFASTVRTVGALPALHNAWLMTGVPVRLLGVAIGQAVFPRIAAHAVDGEWGAMRRTLLRSLGVALALAAAVTVGLLLAGRLIIWALFEHGQFDAAAGTLTYRVLAVFALSIPASTATEILTRGLVSLYDTRTPLITNCAQLLGRMALIPLLLPALDVIAIPLAFTLTASLEALALGGILAVKVRRRMGGA
jgi:putative peptidoglycan lipid II flippase